MKYGVVGRNVNLTSRIESYTVGGQIFISENTMEECGRNLLRIDDRMEVMPKGVKKPITIYEVGGIKGEFNLFLPEKVEAVLMDLPHAIPIEFMVLEGKHAAETRYRGTVDKLFEKTAQISAEIAVDKLTNLKISLFDHEKTEVTSDLYAKVVKSISEDPAIFRVSLTSIPPSAAAFLKRMTPDAAMP
jgi:adenylate cyclase